MRPYLLRKTAEARTEYLTFRSTAPVDAPNVIISLHAINRTRQITLAKFKLEDHDATLLAHFGHGRARWGVDWNGMIELCSPYQITAVIYGCRVGDLLELQVIMK